MDIEMISTTDEDTKENYWDFKVKDGKLCWIDYSTATQQRSIIATYLQRGTIPQLPDVGNQWVEFSRHFHNRVSYLSVKLIRGNCTG